MTKKHSKKTFKKKHWNSENILYLVGVGVSQIHEKKIVSVGLFSTFRHPLVVRTLLDPFSSALST